ncbi:putative SV2-like protein 1, partial [Operophtera brumata]
HFSEQLRRVHIAGREHSGARARTIIAALHLRADVLASHRSRIDFLGITYRSWRLLALVMAVPCAATAGLLQLFHESPKFLASRGRYEDALHVLKRIYACNTGCHADSFPIKKLIEDDNSHSICHASFFRSLWQQTVPLFQRPLLKDTLKLFYLVVIIYMTGSGFIMWLPYIMNSLFSVLESGGGDGMNLCAVIRLSTQDSFLAGNSTETTLFSAMTYGALASCSNLVLSLTCGSRKRVAMMCILTTSATAAVLLNVVAVPLAGGIFFFFFLLCALSMGLLSVYFVELYPTSLRGMASCLSVMLGRSSAFFGVNAIGALISANCEATFYAWSLLLLRYGSTILVPTSACELQTTATQQGLLAAAPVVGLILGTVLWGYLADTRGRRSMLLVALLGGAVVNCLASLSVNWIMLMVLQFVASILACRSRRGTWWYFSSPASSYWRKDSWQVTSILREDSGAAQTSSEKSQITPLFKSPLLKYTIIMSLLLLFQQTGAFIVWLPTIADQFVRIMDTGEGSNQTLCGIIGTSLEAPSDPDAVPCALNITALLIVLAVGAMQSIINFLLSLGCSTRTATDSRQDGHLCFHPDPEPNADQQLRGWLLPVRFHLCFLASLGYRLVNWYKENDVLLVTEPQNKY